MAKAKIKIYLSEPIGIITPTIYGHFAEHLGGVIYDGIWVGEQSDVPNVRGIRSALVEAMRKINPPVVRWPGGCFADHYDWRDGIGPKEKRPKRTNFWMLRDPKHPEETNAFGTHEFIDFCHQIGAEPYIVANVGSGSPKEFARWVEYCNCSADTSLTRERRANGSPKPFGVRYWGIGNENWGCGGHFTPEDYCAQYTRFATYAYDFGVGVRLIACGPSGNDLEWTRRFFEKLTQGRAGKFRAPIWGFAPHYYCGSAGTALEFTDSQWYQLLSQAAYMGTLIQEQWEAMAEYDPQHQVKLVVDEWGCWHPSGSEINPCHLYEQMSTLRDALAAALTLDIFNNHCNKVAMANLAQLVNNLHSLFLADGHRFVCTPNYYVFDMYKEHQGAKCLRTEFEADDISYTIDGEKRTIPGLWGSASVRESRLTLTLVNPGLGEPLETEIVLVKGEVKKAVQTVLTHRDIHAHNTFRAPDVLMPKSKELGVTGEKFTAELQRASVSKFTLALGT